MTAELFARLRQRKVVQWMLGYMAGAWVLAQVLALVGDQFGWTPAVQRGITAMLGFGAFPAFVFAWFHGERGAQRISATEALALTLAIAGTAGAGWWAARTAVEVDESGQGGTIHTTSITRLDKLRVAVLPLDNLGGVQANAAFTGGFHDTLITQVSRVPHLTVISRTSVMQWEGKHPSVREVATQLGVGTVLEGSVQREGDRVRVNVQLVDAVTDTHLWAETFDRDAHDLFAVQSEIAQAVAEQLRVRLSNADSQRLAVSGTNSPEAYEHYALGRSAMSHSAGGEIDRLQEAITQLATAVTLDPEFAAAHAQLSIAQTWLAFQDPTRRKDILPLAKASAERAVALDPTLPEGHLARAVYLYRGDPDVAASAVEFEMAIAGLPNDSLAHTNFGLLRSYQGRFEEAAALFARAAELDPRGSVSNFLINSLAFLGRRDAALEAIERARAAQPENVGLALRGGLLAFDFDCDLHAWETSLEALPKVFSDDWQALHARWLFALTTGAYDEAIKHVERWGKTQPDEDLSNELGWTYSLAGRRVDAAMQNRRYLQRALRGLEERPSGDAAALELAYMARAYALLGNRADSIKYANRAVATLPPTGAVRQRPMVLLVSAAALGQVGEFESALALVRQLLDLPFDVKPRGLWCGPTTGPLRADPAFRTMMSDHGADVSIDPHRRETWPPPGST